MTELSSMVSVYGAIALRPAVSVLVTPADSADARRAERELDMAGTPVPLTSRPGFQRHLGRPGALSLVALDATGRCLAMLTMSAAPTRALPGHHMLRIEAVGDSLATPVGVALLEEAARITRARARALRLVVEVECLVDTSRDYLGAALAGLGFHRTPCDRIPDRTIVIDLARDEEAVFAGFGKSTRQNIRAAPKQGLTVVSLDDPACGPRMNELLAQALSRTGGTVHAVDWASVMRLCAELPDRSRIAGVFRGSSRAPEDLVGYAWGLHHGDRVEYHTGASARLPDVKIRILCPVLWDLIRWGRRTGGRWFDLGGVTQGSAGSEDALGGISDFKRGFSREEVAIGQEWALDPSPLRWRLSTWVSRAAHWVRRRSR